MSDSNGSDVEMENIEDEELVDLDAELQQTKKELETDPFNIVLNNKYISLLAKNGDFEELLEFRQKYSEWGPLNVENWITWIKDVRESGSPYDTVNEYFNRAVADCNSLNIWLERISVAAGISVEESRRICEDAITAIGTRYDVGGNIWIAYIDMETIYIQTSSNEETQKKQVSRVHSIFRRALLVPTVDLKEVFTLASAFANEFDPSFLEEYKKLYAESSKEAVNLAVIEEKLKDNDYTVFSFNDLLEYYDKKGDPGRVQMVLERVVEKNPEVEDAWIQYGTWCEQKLKVHGVTCSVYERSVKHCPYSCPLFQQTLLAYERAGVSEEKIDQLWSNAKINCITSADTGRALYRTYIYLLRRRQVNAGSTDFSNVEAVFVEGETFLKENFSQDWDPQAQFRKNLAWFCASTSKNIVKARKTWEDILASGFGRYAAKWIEAARLERQFGKKEHVRKILNKALNSVADNPNEIYEYYVQFEREEGSLEELDFVLEKVNSQIQHRASRPQRKEPEPVKKQNDKKRKELPQKRQHAAQPTGFVKKNKVENDDVPMKDSDGFAVPTSFKTADQSSTASVTRDLSHVSVSPENDATRTVFVSNLDFKATEDDIKGVLDGVVQVRFGTRVGSKVHRGFAYVVLRNEKDVKEALGKDRVLINGRPMLISENNPEKRVGFKYSAGVENKKLFVRNVHFAATEQQLREVFASFGELEAVRLVVHKSGQPKGIAYVDFKEASGAEKALAAESIVLLDRPLTVAISNPPKKGERSFEPAPERPKVALGSSGPLEAGQRKGHAGMLQMVPRAARSSNPESTAPTAPNGAPKDKPMSNDQFRKLLLKK